ncbi:MAG: GNAT family N-acetyltransferase [Pseudomonadales bacterium]|nr:GNAT family N-acetyltransferase [Pseudomonadales bacterium]
MPLDDLPAVRVVKIGKSNASQAQSIFFHAYRENTFLRYILNANRRGYEQRLRGFIREQLRAHYRDANLSLAIAIKEKLVGAVMVSRADDPRNFTSSWRWRLSMYSIAGVYYTEQIRHYYEQLHTALRQIDHYWISLVALHPNYQHHGYGHALVQAVHQECEKDNLFQGLSIDTSDPHAKGFFESLGYYQVAEVPLSQFSMDVLFHPRSGTECPFTPNPE